LPGDRLREISMMIPARVVKLNETDPSLRQAASEEAIGSVRARLTSVLTIIPKNIFRFI
jgi:hypothetical protein